MALIACPECDRGLSSTADKCPHCGFIFSDSNELKKLLWTREEATDLYAKYLPRYVMLFSLSALSLFIAIAIGAIGGTGISFYAFLGIFIISLIYGFKFSARCDAAGKYLFKHFPKDY